MAKNDSYNNDQHLASSTLIEIRQQINALFDEQARMLAMVNAIQRECVSKAKLDEYFKEIFDRIVRLKFPEVHEVIKEVIVPQEKIKTVEISVPIITEKIVTAEVPVIVEKVVEKIQMVSTSGYLGIAYSRLIPIYALLAASLLLWGLK